MNLSFSESMAKAASLYLAGKTAEALGELQAAKRNGSESPKLDSAVGHLHFEQGEFAAAAAAYRNVLGVEPNNSTAHYNLGICLDKLGAWEEAASEFQRSIDIDPRRTGSYVGLG